MATYIQLYLPLTKSRELNLTEYLLCNIPKTLAFKIQDHKEEY